MNTTMNQIDTMDNDNLIEAAKSVFGSGYMEALARAGLDFLEGRGKGAWMTDTRGNTFLDAYTSGGTHNLGRCPAPLVRALERAVNETDQGNFVLISEEKTALARALAAFMPGNLDCAYFTVVRGEAMEAACKLARGRTGRPNLICFSGAYHGESGFALSLSEREGKRAFGPLIPGITPLPFNRIEGLDQAINQDTAAVIIEPVQVENGCTRAGTEFIWALKQACNRAGALMIMDETQTGFGRTGARFACEGFGIQPDILVFGEAVCGGMFNMSGLSFTPEVKTFFDDHPLIHLCTFGGHDLGCRIAVKALELYGTVQPWENAVKIETALAPALAEIEKKYPHAVKAVNAVGGLGAITFKGPALAEAFCRGVKAHGAIVARGRIQTSAVLIRPALTLTRDEINTLVHCIEKGAEAL